MHTTRKDTTTYLYSFRDSAWIHSFASEEKLLEYLVKNYKTFFGEDNDVNLTWKDTRVVTDWTQFAELRVLRNYVLVDANYHVINPDVYRDRVDAMIASLEEEDAARLRRYEELGITHIWRRWSTTKQVPHDELAYGDVLHNSDTNYHFRQEPVPGLGLRRWRFRCWYRRPRTTAEMRDIVNPESAPYVRRKRKNVPTAWDDIPKCIQRSWKKQGKKRKQWM